MRSETTKNRYVKKKLKFWLDNVHIVRFKDHQNDYNSFLKGNKNVCRLLNFIAIHSTVVEWFTQNVKCCRCNSRSTFGMNHSTTVELKQLNKNERIYELHFWEETTFSPFFQLDLSNCSARKKTMFPDTNTVFITVLPLVALMEDQTQEAWQLVNRIISEVKLWLNIFNLWLSSNRGKTVQWLLAATNPWQTKPLKLFREHLNSAQ